MSAARVVASAAVSALGRGRAAVLPSGPSAVGFDRALAALGLGAPRAARVELTREGAVDPARALLALAAEELTAALDQRAPGWRARRLCVVLGTSSGGMVSQEAAFEALANGADVSPALAAQASYFGPLQGLAGILPNAPLVQVYAACASSAMALGVALRVLQSGAADLVIAGGYDVIAPLVAAGFESLGVVTASEPRPFSLARDGLALGEGAALLALTRAEPSISKAYDTAVQGSKAPDAAEAAALSVSESHETAAQDSAAAPDAEGAADRRERSARYLLGFAASSDAAHPTAPAPGAPGLVAAAQRALAEAGAAAPEEARGPRIVNTSDESSALAAAQAGLDEAWLISAHGTATLANDREEALAIAQLSARAPVHAFKARVGHTLGAGSALELLAAFECLEHGAPALPSPPHELALSAPRPAHPRGASRVLKLAMAFGGCNVALTAARSPINISTTERYGARLAQVGSPVREPETERLARLGRAGPLTARRLDALSALCASAALSLLSAEELRAFEGEPLGVSVRKRIGVVVGTLAATLSHNQGYHAELMRRGHGRAPPRGFPATSPNLAPGMVSILFGLGGPCFSVGAGAAAPLEALFVATQLIEAGDADEVWVIAADVVTEDVGRLLAAAGLELLHGALAARVVRAADSEPRLDSSAILAQLTHVERSASSSRQSGGAPSPREGWPRLLEWLQGDGSGCARGPSK
ncbi:MAG: hypothetical protein KIT72_10435 [Polyangiaceae bacterium]|nr:hypothetical protein [Polyangiaceae bacterium]MCW5790829.1 hypothetical protein [Polyangiaceae bacterium]